MRAMTCTQPCGAIPIATFRSESYLDKYRTFCIYWCWNRFYSETKLSVFIFFSSCKFASWQRFVVLLSPLEIPCLRWTSKKTMYNMSRSQMGDRQFVWFLSKREKKIKTGEPTWKAVDPDWKVDLVVYTSRFQNFKNPEVRETGREKKTMERFTWICCIPLVLLLFAVDPGKVVSR